MTLVEELALLYKKVCQETDSLNADDLLKYPELKQRFLNEFVLRNRAQFYILQLLEERILTGNKWIDPYPYLVMGDTISMDADEANSALKEMRSKLNSHAGDGDDQSALRRALTSDTLDDMTTSITCMWCMAALSNNEHIPKEPMLPQPGFNPFQINI